MIYSAAEARDVASNKRAVFDEINRIEPLIMDAIQAGSLEVSIGPGSTPPITAGFTISATHFNAFTKPSQFNEAAHKLARQQMNEVIKHFQLKGYQVRISQEGSTTTFNWVIKW